MVVPMRQALHASTGQLSGALSLAIGVSAAAAVPVGRWLDRHGPRALMTAGSLLGAASVAGWSQAQTLPQLYAAFAGMGLASAAVLYEPAFAVINTWFARDRHAALLTLTVVAGFSSTIFVPTSQALVDAAGWRTALLMLAGLLATCAVPHALLLRRFPTDLGLSVDGRPAAAAPLMKAERTATLEPPQLAEVDGGVARFRGPGGAWRSAPVRALTLAAVLETLAVTVIGVHLVAFLRDTGVPAGTAALAAGALGVLSVTGRITLTALAARVGLARVAAAMVGGQALGVAALLLLPGPVGTVVFVLLFGAGFGVMTIARAALLGAYVPTVVFAEVSGRQALATNAGRVVAPAAAGGLINTAGYPATFTTVAACCLAAGALLMVADRARLGVLPHP